MDLSKMCNDHIHNRTNATTLATEDLIAASSFLTVVLLVFHLFYFPMLPWQQKENSVQIYLSKHEQLVTAEANYEFKMYDFDSIRSGVLIHRLPIPFLLGERFDDWLMQQS